MAVYLALFAVMWKYAPADEEEEDEEVQQEGGWCPLLSGGETSAQAGAGAEGESRTGISSCCLICACCIEHEQR